MSWKYVTPPGLYSPNLSIKIMSSLRDYSICVQLFLNLDGKERFQKPESSFMNPSWVWICTGWHTRSISSFRGYSEFASTANPEGMTECRKNQLSFRTPKGWHAFNRDQIQIDNISRNDDRFRLHVKRSVTKSEALYPIPPMPSITGLLFVQCYTLTCEILHEKG